MGIKELIEKYPNDQELGEAVRKWYKEEIEVNCLGEIVEKPQWLKDEIERRNNILIEQIS